MTAIVGIVCLMLASLHAHRRISREARPLIEALAAFERDEGRPPASLEDLVPRHIEVVPSPAHASRDHFVYELRGSGETWELVVHGSPSLGLLGEMRYSSNGDYDLVRARGGSVELYEGWAFVDD